MRRPAAVSFAPADVERRLAEIIEAAEDARPWLHGGIPGLSPGDLLLPSAITGNLNGACSRCRYEIAADRDFVYVTKDPSQGAINAAAYPGGGTLYKVQPIGEMAVDPYIVRMIATHPAWRHVYRAHLRTRSPLGIAQVCRSARVVNVIGNVLAH